MNYIRLINGTESYLMERERRRFLDACNRDFGAAADVRLFSRTASVGDVIAALAEDSLFGGAAVVIWTDCPFLPLQRGGRTRTKATAEEREFADFLGKLPSRKALLFYTAGKVNEKAPFFRLISALTASSYYESVTDKTVMPYVDAYLKKRGKVLTGNSRAYLQEIFQTWEEIPLLYVFTELDKLCISLAAEREIDVACLTGLFAGSLEKNMFTFTDCFLRRDGMKTTPFLPPLFTKSDVFLKTVGYMASRLRLLLAYKELTAAGLSARQCEAAMTQINHGRNGKYLIFHLKKVAKYWKMEELKELLQRLFTLQLHMRRGTASADDVAALVCLYCSNKGRVS